MISIGGQETGRCGAFLERLLGAAGPCQPCFWVAVNELNISYYLGHKGLGFRVLGFRVIPPPNNCP